MAFCLPGLLRALQPVLVSRVDPDSRKNTINEIKKRAMSGGEWPQVRLGGWSLVYTESLCLSVGVLIWVRRERALHATCLQPDRCRIKPVSVQKALFPHVLILSFVRCCLWVIKKWLSNADF